MRCDSTKHKSFWPTEELPDVYHYVCLQVDNIILNTQRALLCDERDSCTINNSFISAIHEMTNIRKRCCLTLHFSSNTSDFSDSVVAMLRRTRVVRCKRFYTLT